MFNIRRVSHDSRQVLQLLRFYHKHTKQFYVEKKGEPYTFTVETEEGPIPIYVDSKYLDAIAEEIELQLTPTRRSAQIRPRTVAVESKSGQTERCPVCSCWHRQDWREVHSGEAGLADIRPNPYLRTVHGRRMEL
jgi:hypothetical protein